MRTETARSRSTSPPRTTAATTLDNAVTTPLTVKITDPSGHWLKMSATYAELEERSAKIEPEIRYEASPSDYGSLSSRSRNYRR